MGVFFGEVTLETVKGRASYHDISDEIRENIKKSELKNGCVVILLLFQLLPNLRYCQDMLQNYLCSFSTNLINQHQY